MSNSAQQTSAKWAMVRRWPVVLAVLALMLPFVWQARETTGVYWTRVNVVFLPPPGAAAGNPLRSESQDVVQFAAVIQRLAITESSIPPLETNGAILYATGIRNGYSVYLPNAGTQWQPSYNRASIAVEVVAEDAESVTRMATELAEKIAAAATEQQDALGVQRGAHITTVLSPSAAVVSYHTGKPAHATAVLLVLTLGLAAAAVQLFDRLPQRRTAAHAKPLKPYRR